MSPLRFLARLLLPDWPGLLLATLASVSAELSSVTLIATAAWLIARAAERPTLDALAIAIVAVRALALGRGILRYGERLLGHRAVLVTMARLRAHVYRTLTPLAPAATSTFRDGDLLSRLIGDVDAAQDLVPRCLLPALAAVLCGAAAVGLCVLILPSAAAAVAAGLVVAGVAVPLLVMVASNRAGSATLALRGQLAAQSVDLIHGSADLAAFGATDRQLAEANRTSTALAHAERGAAVSVGSAGAAILLVQGLTTAAVATLATTAGLPTVPLTVLTVTTLSVFEILTPLPSAARTWIQVRAGAHRLMRLLATPPPVHEPEHPVAAPTGPVSIELRGVTVRHPGADSPVIHDLDLRVRPGQRIVVLGASGSGKSTLLATLMRFVDYTGSIRLNGHELRDHHSDDVRAAITGVTQDAHLFHASITTNIGLARPEATLAELRDVADKSRILDWIEGLPRQWDTIVGENGSALSGGQRQRLLLARALLADPAVLLLDEPTEGLDPEPAELVLADLLDATRDRTTILVTHHDIAPHNTHQTVVLGRSSDPEPMHGVDQCRYRELLSTEFVAE